MGGDELATLRLVALALPTDERALVERAADELARLRAEVAALERGQLLATGRTARVIWTPTGVSVRVDEA